MVAHFRVVTDMRTFKQEVVITDDGFAVTLRTAIDDHVLADDIVVANYHVRLGTTEVEILRQGGNNATLVDFVVVADSRAVADADEGEDNTVITYLHIVLDIHEGEYLTVITDFRLWADFGLWTYFTCHIIIFILFLT